MKREWTVKRILIIIALMPVVAFALYIVFGFSAYAYLTHSYNGLHPGMTRAQVQSKLRGFSEAKSTVKEISAWSASREKDISVYRYDLVGLKWLDVPIYVTYDKKGRSWCAIDAYE
jgi:hypothetical protein